jgi:putative redox protein
MTIEQVRLDWLREKEFLLRDRGGYPILLAQPMGVNGADLLPLSLIGCAAWDVIAILQKQRQPVSAFEVVAESEREDQAPWRFLKIRVTYRLTGRGLDRSAIERAIALTEGKYCSTFATLRPAVEISSGYEVIEAGDSSKGPASGR